MAESLEELELDDALEVISLLSGPPTVIGSVIPTPGRGVRLATKLVEDAEAALGLDETTLSNEQRLFIIAYATAGTVSGACRSVGVSPTTHRRWLKDDNYFEVFTTAFDVVTDRLEETSLKASLDPLNTRERMFQLQSRRPERYASRIGVAVKGKVDHVHSIADLARQAYNEGVLDKEDDDGE